MKNFKRAVYVTTVLFLGGVLTGCGTNKQNMSGQNPAKTLSSGESPAGKPVRETLAQYTVRRHDCLWQIAGKPNVYGDSFEWPLLFKTNRDEIKDPDLIYSHQVLKVQKGFAMEEINHAKQVASATPKFVPHTQPRETLPVDYF